MRLLVATEFPPNASGGGPAVVRHMLKAWPASDLLWWSCFPDSDAKFGQRVVEHRVARIPKKLRPHQRATRLKSAALEWFWAPWAARHFNKTLRTLRPDAIWVIPHNWSVPPLAAVLAGDGCFSEASQPAFHVTMQDYVDAHGHREKFGKNRCERMVAQAEQLYAAATTRDATSHPMIADLKAKTGRDAEQMLHAGLEPEDFAFLQQKKPGPDRKALKIAYAGTILVEDVFELFVSAVQRIRDTLSMRVELHLFGAHSYSKRQWFDRHWMYEHGNLQEADLLRALRNCSWGFAPMALVDDDPRYNRFSFPTKFITYLAAGLPVITIGHPESSVVTMARSYDVGFCASTVHLEELAGELRAALSDPHPWEHFKSEILRCTQTEFDTMRMRGKLYECFKVCASTR